jgi:hypothetical protein
MRIRPGFKPPPGWDRPPVLNQLIDSVQRLTQGFESEDRATNELLDSIRRETNVAPEIAGRLRMYERDPRLLNLMQLTSCIDRFIRGDEAADFRVGGRFHAIAVARQNLQQAKNNLTRLEDEVHERKDSCSAYLQGIEGREGRDPLYDAIERYRAGQGDPSRTELLAAIEGLDESRRGPVRTQYEEYKNAKDAVVAAANKLGALEKLRDDLRIVESQIAAKKAQ